MDREGPTPSWAVISKTRRGGHLHLGRCFSVGASHNVLTDDSGHKLFSFVVLGGQDRHIFWADSEEERNNWLHDIQAVVGTDVDATVSKSRGGAQIALHDHMFWDTVLWELRTAHQIELEGETGGARSSTGIVTVGTKVSEVLNGSPASQRVRCLHSNEEIQIEVGDEILDVNNETVSPETCASQLRGEDVVGSMIRIKIRKHSQAEPASPIAQLNDTSTLRLLSPGQSPSSATPSRSAIHAFSPYRWEGKSQLGRGEYEVDFISVPFINLMRFHELKQSIKKLDVVDGAEQLTTILHEQADGVMKSLEIYSSYASSHLGGLENVFHGWYL